MDLKGTIFKFGSKLGLIASLLALELILETVIPLKHWENYFFDTELSWFSEPAVKNDIAIIEIDDFSLKQFGKWPWSRRKHAELINLLSTVDAKAIGLDVIFAEPDLADPEADQLLAEAIKANGRVVLPVLPDIKFQGGLQAIVPMPALLHAAAAIGHVDSGTDNDGVIRSVYLKAGMNGVVWPAFALALLNLGQPDVLGGAMKGVRNPKAEFTANMWNRDYGVQVPFIGSNGHFYKISYAQVFNDPKVKDRLCGKYILIGPTAAGLATLFLTPQHNNIGLITGIEVHANILDALLNDLTIEPVNPLWGHLLTAFLVMIPLLGYQCIVKRHALSFSLVFSGLAIIASVLLLKNAHFWYSPLPVVLTLALAYLFWDWERIRYFTRSLFKEKQLAKAALHSIADAVVTTKAWGLIVYMNPAAEKLTGFSLEQAHGQPISAVIQFTDDEAGNGFDGLIASLQKGQNVKEITPRRIINKSGKGLDVQISASPIKGQSGDVIGMVFAFNDITESIQISQQMTYLATHDALTGLANRTLFYEQIERAIAACNRQGNNLALLFIDLDDFKKVNDGMGHAAGDSVLIETASRLLANMRQTDTVARWGGDEFVVLLNQLPSEENTTYVIAKVVERLSRPYQIEGQTLYVTPSIGISVFPKDGLTADELLANADTAMFQVKENGRNNFSFFSSDFDKPTRHRLDIETELYSALAEGHFEVYYQPQLDLISQKVVAAEALLRWNHPRRGMIPPDSFISLAEDTGLINPIGEWVLLTVCKQINAWQKMGLPEICIGVNLSPCQFLHNDVCNSIQQALKTHDVMARQVKIEITEGLMIKNVESVAKMLWDIRALGVGISVDDFGTGYSSLSVLRNFPIDQLKIDKSFINHMESNPDDVNIIQSIIMLGHNMGMQVVAEGVENKKQFDILKLWKCDYIQGYYFSHPLTAAVMTELLQQQRKIKYSPAL